MPLPLSLRNSPTSARRRQKKLWRIAPLKALSRKNQTCSAWMAFPSPATNKSNHILPPHEIASCDMGGGRALHCHFPCFKNLFEPLPERLHPLPARPRRTRRKPPAAHPPIHEG